MPTRTSVIRGAGGRRGDRRRGGAGGLLGSVSVDERGKRWHFGLGILDVQPSAEHGLQFIRHVRAVFEAVTIEAIEEVGVEVHGAAAALRR
jgi:hypothetical protein